MKPKALLPVAVLALALGGAAVLIATSKPVEGRPAQQVLRPVRVMQVESQSVELVVTSQGTVMPRTESELIPEISGRVIWTSPALVSGGYFEQDEPLLRIDPTDYRAALERARAGLTRAEGEHAHARAMLRRQRGLAARDIVSSAALENAEREEQVTGANLRDARVALDQAERDLTRAEIRAPFRGRVRDEQVDVGQFLNRGASFATIYATDYLEVRLPIPDDQLAYLDAPLWQGATDLDATQLPPVRLLARFAGAERRWDGHIVRTEGEIDAKSRMVHVVARFETPERDAAGAATPLPVGLFVQAEIQGSAVQDVVVIPRAAMQNDDQVLVVDSEDRLRFRRVDVLRAQRDQVLIRGGLQPGERVCVSQLQDAIDGAQVRPLGDATPTAPALADSPAGSAS